MLPLLLLSLLLVRESGALTPIQCRDPDVGGSAQNVDRKFMVLGSENGGGAGLGNILIFYPAAYYFAAITGRDIIISDQSIVGAMCSIVHCGFPFVSQVSLAFPEILTPEALANADNIKSEDFLRFMEGSRQITSKVVRAAGYQSKTDWFLWFNTTVHCVQRLTGCDLGDVGCAERHAFQRLVRGPFQSHLSAEEEKRIHGVPDMLKHALLTLPHAYAPRLDAAVHLRPQFHHFEQQASVDDPQYRKEVAEFLNGSECRDVFQAMESRLVELVDAARPRIAADAVEAGAVVVEGVVTKAVAPFYVYLAADNQEVKQAFFEKISANQLLAARVKVMQVQSRGVMHAKNLARLKEATSNEGLLDLVFDWYALSLANTVLAWRKGGVSMLSTFVLSAQRLSGTTERTDVRSGKGIGTRGYQLQSTKRGGLTWDFFWMFSFLEDFQIR